MLDFYTRDDLVSIVLVLAFLDYLLAVINAIRCRAFNSDVGLKGITKKLAVIVLILFASYLKLRSNTTGVIDMIALDGLIAGIILKRVSIGTAELREVGLEDDIVALDSRRYTKRTHKRKNKSSSQSQQGGSTHD